MGGFKHRQNTTSIAKKIVDAIEECKSPIKSINIVTDLDTQLQAVVKANIYKLHIAI